jgi:hypothetical protein
MIKHLSIRRNWQAVKRTGDLKDLCTLKHYEISMEKQYRQSAEKVHDIKKAIKTGNINIYEITREEYGNIYF